MEQQGTHNETARDHHERLWSCISIMTIIIIEEGVHEKEQEFV